MRIIIESVLIVIGWYLIFAYVNLSFDPHDFKMSIGTGKECSALLMQVFITLASVAVNYAAHDLGVRK